MPADLEGLPHCSLTIEEFASELACGKRRKILLRSRRFLSLSHTRTEKAVLVASGDRQRVRFSDSGCQLNACLRSTVKLQRAHGGCLGDERRRRTWTAALSSGERRTRYDPEISEWDNPWRDYLPGQSEYIALCRRTWGTETSKYPEEKKTNSDSPSSGERTGTSLNRQQCRGRGTPGTKTDPSRTAWNG